MHTKCNIINAFTTVYLNKSKGNVSFSHMCKGSQVSIYQTN